jgi:hypothetical protein
MKIGLLNEEYCKKCGGWDKEQGGVGHGMNCPTGARAGTPIKQRVDPELETYIDDIGKRQQHELLHRGQEQYKDYHKSKLKDYLKKYKYA